MSFSLSNISGSQIQKDSFINNLTVACDPGLVAPKNLNGLPNPLNLDKRDGKSAIAVDICCLDLACLNVSEQLTVNNAIINTITTTFLAANNANIDVLQGREVILKASNGLGEPQVELPFGLTIGGTALGDAVGGNTAIKILGALPTSAPGVSSTTIDMQQGGNISMQLQGTGTLKNNQDLSTYITSGANQPAGVAAFHRCRAPRTHPSRNIYWCVGYGYHGRQSGCTKYISN